MAGFEPTNARVKVWCLTAWRHPNVETAPAIGHTQYYSTAQPTLQLFFVKTTRHRYKKEPSFRLTLLCVGVTYLPGQSPAKYCRRK